MSQATRPAILIQLDPDAHASVFDSIVAIDSGIDHLLTFSNVEPLDVRDLVHGAMFTRGGDSLRRTAIFIGGANVQAGEQILRAVLDSFFGNIRVSVMLDASGANTTAVAAVLSLEKHLDLNGKNLAVTGSTGSVGRRVVWLAAQKGAAVTVVSRNEDRAAAVCRELMERDESLQLFPATLPNPGQSIAGHALEGCDALISAGAAGAQLVDEETLRTLSQLQVAIDLNAVPPSGIGGVAPADKAVKNGNLIVYGALGVGGLKMKIHRRCVESLFERNDRVLDLDEIYATGQALGN